MARFVCVSEQPANVQMGAATSTALRARDEFEEDFDTGFDTGGLGRVFCGERAHRSNCGGGGCGCLVFGSG